MVAFSWRAMPSLPVDSSTVPYPHFRRRSPFQSRALEVGGEISFAAADGGDAYGLIPRDQVVVFSGRCAVLKATRRGNSRRPFHFPKGYTMELDCREEEPLLTRNKFLIHPVSRKAIEPGDVDGWIDGLEAVKKMMGMMFIHKETIEDALIKHAKGIKTKTRHVNGEHRKCDVVMPDDKQNGAALKIIAEGKTHKLIWPQLIRIAGYSVKMKEFNVAKNTKGTKKWNAFRDSVAAAIGPPTSRPRVVIKE